MNLWEWDHRVARGRLGLLGVEQRANDLGLTAEDVDHAVARLRT